MKFIHLTDTHVRERYSDDGVDALLGKLPGPAENIRNLFQRTDWKDIDFVVITGDLVHEGTTEDYRYLKRLMEECVPAEIKVLYVLGNHDHKKEFYQGFFHQEKEESYYYTDNIQGYRLIVLDSAIPGKESGTVTDEQLKWLKEILATPSEKGSIVFLHHAVFWSTGGTTKELTNGSKVLEILKGTDVIAVFCGHTHTNAVQEREGITQYTADSIAFSIEVNKGILAFTDKVGYATAEVREQEIMVHYETAKEDVPLIEFTVAEFTELLAKMDEQGK